MKMIITELNHSLSIPLYIQLYQIIRNEIVSGKIKANDKLPSLRALARDSGISITTAQLAYNQLLVEGYIISKPQSGYYVVKGYYNERCAAEGYYGSDDVSVKAEAYPSFPSKAEHEASLKEENAAYINDRSCFDFNKWKKCCSSVFNEYCDFLLCESDPQGESLLRTEIAEYLYSSRGVSCIPGQIVIGAGTQQITGQLCRILSKIGINHVSAEAPGYLPVQNMFRDSGFSVSGIPVQKDGIEIEKLPSNIRSAVYVSPSNQFPTGAVMPAGRRYALLDWASANGSIIIEDDYDSELRYFGKPVPPLKSLDSSGTAVYLGSFSSTLFPAIKISYMVLPPALSEIFKQIKGRYTQACSKAEQLTLALFMKRGYYRAGIRKLRNLYSQKLQKAVGALSRFGGENTEASDTQSGINLIMKVRSEKSTDELCSLASSIGIKMIPVSDISDQETSALIFYYNRLPLSEIEPSIKRLLSLWELE